MKTVILCPRREGFPDRDALWTYCRPWWQYRFPDWPLIEGHHVTGLFNRSAAINRAAEIAGDWDVAVVIDSDVLIHPPNVVAAVAMAHEGGQMTVPFLIRHNLNERGTRKIVDEDYDGPWEPFIARDFHDQHSSVVAIPRRLYDALGGFDEGFCGWGLEDTAFAIACETAEGPLLRLDGEVWHLNHRGAPEKHGSPPHARNVARAARYRAAQSRGDLAAIKALVLEGRELAQGRHDHQIPRILHRVVPKTTPAIAEAWWAEFGAMHPDWRQMTHRDPLDPADWPLTSPHWRHVANGAQLADLVRLEALLKWGGVYVDQDVQPFRPFDPLLPLEAFAAWEDERVVPNAILGARPDHPAIRECLDAALKIYRRGTWNAGPGVTTRIFPGRNDVLLLPPGSLYDVHYRDPDRDAKMAGPAAPWSFARHHYWGSWLPEPDRRRVPE